MGVQRKWNFSNLCSFIKQDTRGSLHRSSGPTGTLASSSEQSTYDRLLSDSNIIIQPMQFDETDTTTHQSTAFAAECSTTGSLFSIHSAPPVPLTDLGSVQNSSSVGFNIGGAGCDSPRRPISLAIETQYHSSKAIAVFQHQTSEIEEEDNENLLTVSSLTARPLIAKSRELRTTK